MFDIQIDLSSFQRAARSMGGAADEVPFALARAMTAAAHATRAVLVEDVWPGSVKVRNTAFIRRALRVKPAMVRDFRAGGEMRVEIYDNLGRPFLKLHAEGGTKRPHKASRLAIPTVAVSRGASGVRKSQLPRNLSSAVVKGGLIFLPKGRGKKRKLTLMYKLQRAASQPKDVRFYDAFTRLMSANLIRLFPGAMRHAMAHPRRR